jgi:hypothetical protein
VFAGKITDLDWDFESKRIIAVGDGKDKFGHAFLMDTASSVGEISGHSKIINSVSMRQVKSFYLTIGATTSCSNRIRRSDRQLLPRRSLQICEIDL